MLTGHIYDLTSVKSPEHYLKTTKEITNMIGRNYTKNTMGFIQAVENLDLTMPTALADPPISDVLELERWKIQIKWYEDQWDIQGFPGQLVQLNAGGQDKVSCRLCGSQPKRHFAPMNHQVIDLLI